ncbi:MAG TPA: hypothetical protein PLB25_17905 [Rhodoferax sp.]|nr:hypothetical protein [Rhodoferax sp.]
MHHADYKPMFCHAVTVRNLAQPLALDCWRQSLDDSLLEKVPWSCEADYANQLDANSRGTRWGGSKQFQFAIKYKAIGALCISATARFDQQMVGSMGDRRTTKKPLGRGF